MAFFFFFFFFFDDDDGRQFVLGKGGDCRRVWTNCEGLGLNDERTPLRAFLWRVSLSYCRVQNSRAVLLLCVLWARKNTGLSLSFERKESVGNRMCTDRRTCGEHTAFVCATKVLCSLSAENLPKKSVCVFRRRHSPTEEEEEEKEEEKKNRRNARRKRAAAAFRRREDKYLSGREREALCMGTF